MGTRMVERVLIGFIGVEWVQRWGVVIVVCYGEFDVAGLLFIL